MEWVVGLDWNEWSFWIGICSLFDFFRIGCDNQVTVLIVFLDIEGFLPICI